MNGPRIGSLFSGYGGLDMGVTAALGGSVAWHVEYDKAPSKILAHHWPDVPNYGDATAVDWLAVPAIDVLTGGFPCQDVSHAGKRAGLKPDTRSGLWSHMAHAIDQLRPAIVVAENVRGLLSAEAASDLEPCAWCLGDGEPSPLRALGAVLGDLAELGYDSWWHGLRAADVGAPHGRFRVFVVATDTSDTNGAGKHGDGGLDLRTAVSLLPTPRATDGDLMLPSAVTLLPTPAVNDMGEGKTVEAWDEWTAKMQAAHGNGNGHGKSLAIEAQRLLPTPTTEPTTGNGHARHLSAEVAPERWGIYADAIARWEALTRPAPAPTQPSKKGTPQLSPQFSEWLMGLPAGHVTDVPGLSRNDMLKALGNGVVPQQAAHALRLWLTSALAAAA